MYVCMATDNGLVMAKPSNSIIAAVLNTKLPIKQYVVTCKGNLLTKQEGSTYLHPPSVDD